MANEEHLAIIKQGVKAWNKWREDNPDVRPDLSRADLVRANLSGANLSNTDLNYATLWRAELNDATLSEANLSNTDMSDTELYGAHLWRAQLWRSDLSNAQMSFANLYGANLNGANLRRVKLYGANLIRASLIDTNLEQADLTDCYIFGISAWRLKLDASIQKDLVISDDYEPLITVDNLEVAQFIYLLLNNEKIRDVIDTITSKVVLILGRFAPEQKAVLDAIREELRHRNYLPIIFDFDRPASRDLTETISTLAHMARFVIADLTNAKSLPQELRAIIPDLPSVPVQPIIHSGEKEYAMFEHWRRYTWVLPEHIYTSSEDLIAVIPEKIIEPAERKVEELRPKIR